MTTFELTCAIMMAFWSGAIVAMASGALFAYIVFRTKRDSHEPLFATGSGYGGGSYTSDPVDGDTIRDREDMFPPEEPEEPWFPKLTMQQHERMMEDINMQRAKEGAPPLESVPGMPVDAKDKYDD